MRGPGQPAFRPTSAQRVAVTAAVACGSRLDIIAHHIGIDAKTLSKHFKREIFEAKRDANAMVARTLFNSAMRGNVTAAIFWLKCQAGWKETSINEVTGPNGQPLNNSVVVINNGLPIDSAESAMAAYQLMMGNPALDGSTVRFAPPRALDAPLAADEPHPGDAQAHSAAESLDLPTDPLADGLPEGPWGGPTNVIPFTGLPK